MMPGISAMSRARGGEGCCQPVGVETEPSNGIADADTGWRPPVVATLEARPVCQSWDIILPPLAWIAFTIFCQPLTWSSEYIPGAPCQPRPEMEIVVASEMIRPPSEARWL